MAEAQRKWDKLTEEQRQQCINELIDFFERERDEKIGVVAAGELLNFFLQTAGRNLFNQGIETASRTLQTRIKDVMMDLDVLKEYS